MDEARKVRKDMPVNTHMKLRKMFDEGLNITIEVHLAEWIDLLKQVASFTID